MGKFIVEPHFRLQEWVAEEKGYFGAEGLDYEFRELIRSTAGQHHNKGASGAFQSIEKGREADVSCACHWTVAVAASNGHARLYADAYSVAPAGIFVPADSPIRTPADLAGVPISVGFQSGSHYSTIQALEQYLPRDQINLTFEDGMLFRRLELLDRRQEPGGGAVQRPVLPRRAARLPQGDRHDVHDRRHDQRLARSRGRPPLLPLRSSGRSATSICGRSSTPTTTRTSFPSAGTP